MDRYRTNLVIYLMTMTNISDLFMLLYSKNGYKYLLQKSLLSRQ